MSHGILVRSFWEQLEILEKGFFAAFGRGIWEAGGAERFH